MNNNRSKLPGLVAALAWFGAVARGLAADPASATNTIASSAAVPGAVEGHRLFDHNCAHCHGDDARGDEGPDLHGLVKSDARLHKIITDGIKGEMPAFGKKFKDADVAALIAYLRTLKE